MSAINIITQRNLVKQPQTVSEGFTAATYGIIPDNPAFTNHGQDAAISDQSTPTVADNRNAGKVDRIETTKVFEENTIKFTSKVMAVDKDFLAWLNNLPSNAVNTPDESRTIMDSYLDEAGIEQFRVYSGCKPKDSSMSYDIDNYLIIEATLSYKTKAEDITGPTIGSGSFGTPNTGTPLIHLDAGALPFIYNGIGVSIESFSIDTTFNMASQNALGSVVPLFMKPTQREISGSSVIYKKDGDLQKDARAVLEIGAIYIIDSGNIAISFTKFKLLPSGEELKGDDAEATKESKSWEAGSLVLATSTVSSTPTNLIAVTGVLHSSVDLTWDAPLFDGDSSITDYLIEFKLPSSETWDIFPHGSDAILATVDGLTPATEYDFRVSAINATGTSEPSNEAQATSQALTLPDAPTSLAGVTGSGSGEVDIDWVAPINDGGSAIIDYFIEYKLATEPTTWTNFAHGSDAVLATVDGLTPATLYDFRVFTVTAIGQSISSTLEIQVTSQT